MDFKEKIQNVLNECGGVKLEYEDTEVRITKVDGGYVANVKGIFSFDIEEKNFNDFLNDLEYELKDAGIIDEIKIVKI